MTKDEFKKRVYEIFTEGQFLKTFRSLWFQLGDNGETTQG